MNGPRFTISRVILPFQPELMVGAVKWTMMPVRAFVLFAFTKEISSGLSSGVPTTSSVVQSRKPYGFRMTC